MRAALRARMAKRYDELDAWQLANELKLGVYRLIETGTVTRTGDCGAPGRWSRSEALHAASNGRTTNHANPEPDEPRTFEPPNPRTTVVQTTARAAIVLPASASAMRARACSSPARVRGVPRHRRIARGAPSSPTLNAVDALTITPRERISAAKASVVHRAGRCSHMCGLDGRVCARYPSRSRFAIP